MIDRIINNTVIVKLVTGEKCAGSNSCTGTKPCANMTVRIHFTVFFCPMYIGGNLRRFGGFPNKSTARRLAIFFTVFRTAGIHVVPDPIAVVALAGKSHRRSIRKTKRTSGFYFNEVVSAIGYLRITIGIATHFRLFGYIVNGTAGCVSTEKRVLRTTQYFDSLHIVQADRGQIG